MFQRRRLTNPTFRTLEYMQYIDYGLQLEPYQSEILIRKGLILIVSKKQKRSFENLKVFDCPKSFKQRSRVEK